MQYDRRVGVFISHSSSMGSKFLSFLVTKSLRVLECYTKDCCLRWEGEREGENVFHRDIHLHCSGVKCTPLTVGNVKRWTLDDATLELTLHRHCGLEWWRNITIPRRQSSQVCCRIKLTINHQVSCASNWRKNILQGGREKVSSTFGRMTSSLHRHCKPHSSSFIVLSLDLICGELLDLPLKYSECLFKI